MKKKVAVIFTMFILASGFVGAQQSKMNVKIESDQLCFDVSFQGKEVVSTSPLGMNIDNEQYGKNVRIQSADELKEGHKIYTIERGNKMSYQLEVREFNDGVALRYRIPSTGPRCIYGEATSFTFPSDTRVWYASGPFQYSWLQVYQDRLVNTMMNLKLIFLPKGKYEMTVASDSGEDRKKIRMDTRRIQSNKSLGLKLLSGGGYLAKFVKI